MEIQKKMTKLSKIIEHIKHTFYQVYRREEDSEKVNISVSKPASGNIVSIVLLQTQGCVFNLLLLSHFLLFYLMPVWIFKIPSSDAAELSFIHSIYLLLILFLVASST